MRKGMGIVMGGLLFWSLAGCAKVQEIDAKLAAMIPDPPSYSTRAAREQKVREQKVRTGKTVVKKWSGSDIGGMYSEEYIADFALIGNVDAGEVLRQLVSAMKEQVLVQSMGYRQVDGEGVHYAKTSPRKPGGVNPEYRLGVTMDTMKDAMRTRGASEEEIQEALDRTEAEFRACQEKALGKEFFFSAALLERESYMA